MMTNFDAQVFFPDSLEPEDLFVQAFLTHVIREFNATVFDVGTAVGEVAAPDLSITVERVDSTHIRATFNVAVLNNLALNNIGNYEITPTLEVLAIEVEDPSNVLVTTTEQSDGQVYTLEIHSIEAA